MTALLQDAQSANSSSSKVPASSPQTAAVSPGPAPVADGMEKTAARDHEAHSEMDMSALLDLIGLSQLRDVFEREQISIDILAEMGHDELKDIGINAYGHRHRILKAVDKMVAARGKLVFICTTKRSYSYFNY